MAPEQDVTLWVRQLTAGDRGAVQKLWEGYFPRLVELARQRLRKLRGSLADEEDVALSSFDSFCRGAERGRFPRLEDRHDLWHVLVMITVRKAHDLVEYEGRQKRDWRLRERLAPPGHDPSAGPGPAFQELISREPDPGFAAQVAEQCQRLLARLGDDQLRQIAVRKMEGYTNEEIAGQLHIALATVERRLQRIRRRWQSEGAPGGEGEKTEPEEE